MSFSGYKNNEIAERLEMSDTNVSHVIRSPLGQAYLGALQDNAKEATLDVRKKLVSLNSNALKTIERILNPAEKAPHNVQLNAAKDVLDRTGYKAPDKLHVDMTMQTKTDQEIDAEINAMQQSIEKTYLQSPNQSPTKQPAATEQLAPTEQAVPETFTDEQTLAEPNQLHTEDMDSSGTLDNSKKSNQDVQSGICEDSLNSPADQSEESISLVSKIPVNIFSAFTK